MSFIAVRVQHDPKRHEDLASELNKDLLSIESESDVEVVRNKCPKVWISS
jgi:hypothetical protein